MKKDRIVIFNHVINNQIEPCTFFEDIMDNHYRKFVYGYNIIAFDDIIEDITDIECECKANSLLFIVTMTNKSSARKAIELFLEVSKNVYGSGSYMIEISSDEKIIEMTIKRRR